MIELTRAQIVAFRQRVSGLEARSPSGAKSLRAAAWAGLQDSMPRAALLSIHARVEGTKPDTWERRSLVQVWGPRFSAYVVPARDHALFTLGRLPDDAAKREELEALADDIEEFLDGRQMEYGAVGRALGRHPNSLRYAALTGRVLIRWDGARRPTVWTVPRPEADPFDARLELARRHVHVFGPTTAGAFAEWAGITPSRARATFDALGSSLTAVRTPIGEAQVLTKDVEGLRGELPHPAPARLLPSGDTYFLIWGAERSLVVPEAKHRSELWTSRVWPGAVVVDGEVVGTWRRAGTVVDVMPWRRLSHVARDAVEAEACGLPLAGHTPPLVAWRSIS